MPQFVVLEHRTQGVHWDFMLEWGAVLRTWSLAEPPDAARPIHATPLADHRLKYLDYEGPIGGDRGSVTRWDRGTYELLDATEGSVRLRLAGGRLTGAVEIVRETETEPWVYRGVVP